MIGTRTGKVGSVRVIFITIFFTVVLGCYFSCDSPYSPQPEPDITIPGSDIQQSSVRVFPIIGTMQICNPSISMDTTYYPGCMLWLNFSGSLPVTLPDSLDGFGDISEQHDRLTIIDTSNTVRWFMKIDEMGAEAGEELQDPEWSTHPEYIVTLLSQNTGNEWGGYIVHPLKRTLLKIVDKGLEETSTPHVWVASSVKNGGTAVDAINYDKDNCADSEAVQSFFGTDSVKLVYNLKIGGAQSLYLKDYSTDDSLIPLKRPENRERWNCESPLISPDGNWIVFNAYKSEKYYEVYLQKLRAGATPILIEEDASDPHWWVHPSAPEYSYVLYEKVPDWTLVTGDLADERYLENGELGSTWYQMLRLFSEGSTQMNSVVNTGTTDMIVNLPTKGGLSPDGRYLCTGFERGYLIGLSE